MYNIQKLEENKLVRGNYHILKHQKDAILAIATKNKTSESEVVRVALDNHIKDNE